MPRVLRLFLGNFENETET